MRPRVDADVDAPKQDGSTPLLIAALRDQRDIVKSLCGSRTDANKANQDGITPLRAAVLQRLADIAQLVEAVRGFLWRKNCFSACLPYCNLSLI